MATTKSPYKRRIEKAHSLMRREFPSSAFVLSSASVKSKSADQFWPFRQDTDFFYLTGSREKNLVLVLSTENKQPVLIAPKEDPHATLWEGKPPSPQSLARKIGAKLIISENPKKEVKALIKSTNTLIYQNNRGSIGAQLARDYFDIPAHERRLIPNELAHSNVIMERLRLYKTPEEVEQIKKATHITNVSLFEVLPFIGSGNREYQIRAIVEFWFRMQGADVAFDTIAASGVSAATLHYQAHERLLRRGEMVLIDCGASFGGYAADITRVLPVSGEFSEVQADLYQAVYEAQLAAISKVKHGVQIETVYNAAAQVLTLGLMHVGVLKGKLSTLLSKKAYRPYFPHGIGHSLGLDVHDIGQLRGNNAAKLEKGMVFTIEPGLYFPKQVGKVPPCGIRIEDDILVTDKGRENLSEGFPKDLDDIEDMMG